VYAKGDKIVYPMYGAGIIEEIQEKIVEGTTRFYYVLRVPIGNLTIMISALKAADLALRDVHGKEEAIEIIKSISCTPVEMSDNWNQRHKDNMEKIKSGKLCEVSLVYRNLLLRERERGLSSVEKKMLINAKHIILSEIILSQNIEKSAAELMLESLIVDVVLV
jgi:CarD family transcriptional regulator